MLQEKEFVRWPGYPRRMMRLCYVFTAILFVLPWTLRLLPTSTAKVDKAGEISLTRLQQNMIDWEALGKHARKIWRKEKKNNPYKQVVLMAESWHLAALIAFHARLPFEVFTYYPRDAHNFELWRRERGGLKGLTRFLMCHAGGSQPAQFLIDQRQQLFGGNRVALFRTFQNARHFTHKPRIRVQI